VRDKLRHPIRAIEEPFGKAGLIVAIIAVVLALTGAAFAAGGLSGKQKKEVEKIAKKYAGKPGAPGATGPGGSTGAAGKDGANGTNGAPGANGKSVTVSSYTGPECATATAEGVEVKVEGSATPKYVCDGEEGAQGTQGPAGNPWTAGGTLPPSTAAGCPCTETGAWGTFATAAGGAFIGLPFSIPLAAALDGEHVHTFKESNFTDFDEAGPGTEGCKGSAAAPTAPSGNLCVYGEDPVNGLSLLQVKNPAAGLAKGAATAGGVLELSFSGLSIPRGTWAVTG
jgi:hypothetical protein